jgi:PAS domain S-box-containing protein
MPASPTSMVDLLEHVNVPVCLTTQDLKIINANRNFKLLVGLDNFDGHVKYLTEFFKGQHFCLNDYFSIFKGAAVNDDFNLRTLGEEILNFNVSVRFYTEKKLLIWTFSDNYTSDDLSSFKAYYRKLSKIGLWEYDLLANRVIQDDVTREIHGLNKNESIDVDQAINFYKEGDNRNKLKMLFQNCLLTGAPFDEEFEFYDVNGNLKWVRSIGKPLFKDGKIVKIFGSFQDISSEKEKDRRIFHSDELFKKLVSSLDDLVFTLDTEQRHTGVFGKMIQQSALGPSYYLGKTHSDVLGKERAAIHIEAHNKALKGQHVSFEWEYQSEGREVLWFQTKLSPLIGEKGEIFGLVGYVLDITERKKSEQSILEALQRIKKSEKKYSDLFQFSPFPMWVYEIETGRFLEVNQAAKRQYGYSSKEFLEKTIFDIRPEEEVEALKLNLQSRNPKEIVYQKPFIHRKKSGDLIFVEVSSIPLESNGKKSRLTVALDVTVRLNYLKKIEKQNETLKEIAWIQSHVVRSPLAKILGLIDLMQDEQNSIAERKEFMEYLKSSSLELDEAIRDIVEKANIVN